MPITLADVQNVTIDNDIDYATIDELRRASPFVLDRMPFDDVVVPGTNGGSLTAGYTRLKSTRPAHTRQENTEYPAAEAKKRRVMVDLVPMGARYNIDRVHAELGAANEVDFQQSEAVKATVSKFNDLFINGVAGRDFSDEVPEFEGLDSIVTGTITESTNNGAAHDFRGLNTKDKAIAASLLLRKWLRTFDGTPEVFLVNEEGAATLDLINTYLPQETITQDQFGRDVPTYKGIPYVNLGNKGGTVDEEDILTGEEDESNIIPTADDGTTAIYAARFGFDAVHGYATPGRLFKQWLPDFERAGAVKPGEVELGPLAIAVKRTRSAGAFRLRVDA